MNEETLRSLVREAVARHLGRSEPARFGEAAPAWTSQSQARFAVPDGSEGDGACLIEPAVRCNHCGYCQSYGH